jgi:ATP-dependent helicase/nuclease subunit A
VSGFERILLIVANAGSGKTYRLVTRVLELLSLGEPPDRILALTFTRKAAAEFLQNLFCRLAAAAVADDALAKLRDDLRRPGLTRDDCLGWMRQLASALPRLSMGTMDQFFGRIVRAFPLELGLGREWQLMDEAAGEENRRAALEAVFAGAAGERGGLDELIELIRQQDRNRASQSVFKLMADTTAQLQESYLETPPDVVWGDPATIWPDGSPILSAGSVDKAVADLEAAISETNPDLSDEALSQWREWLALARAHRPPGRMDPVLEKFVAGKLTGGTLDKKTGELYVPAGHGAANRLYLRGRLPAAREALLLALLKPELEARLASARALHAILRRFEAAYDANVRRNGALTFSDIARLLAGGAGSAWHRDLEYRLDGRHDHWLLDEFQDTSRLQWSILEPLADEIIQDDSGRRSFFYVGDTKQAIYGWRGGDAQLFWEIRDRYNRGAGDVVKEEQLSVSRRSGCAIVRSVERALQPAAVEASMETFRFPAASVEAWRQAWVTHQPRPDAPEGYVRLAAVQPGDDEEAGQDSLDRALLDILREVRPIERGLDCAILVRTRDTLQHYTALLKARGYPVAGEGKTNPCTTTPLGRAILSLIRAVAFPGDTLACAQALASPLAALMGGGSDDFRHGALRASAADGFSSVLRGWFARLEAGGFHPGADGEAWLAAAADFDATRDSAGGWPEFAHFAEARTVEESETPGAVRVMTIHAAKGLGVDMVILPELGGKGMTDLRDSSGITLRRGPDGRVQWGMAMPRQDFCANDPVLSAAREEALARQSYEALCVLYVAMTRAKKALYCLTLPGRNMKNAGNLLEQTLASGNSDYEDGAPDWFAGHPIIAPASEAAAADLPRLLPASSSPAEAAKPSRTANAGDRASRRAGREIHALLAGLEWSVDPPEGSGAAADAVRAFLRSPEACRIFSRPPGRVLLWRERAFDVMIYGRRTAGVFDRVHVHLDAQDRPESAVVFDFKTGSAEADHSAQMDAYRKAAAILLGLPVDKVATEVVGIV